MFEGLLRKQGQLVLDKKLPALMHAVFLAVIPYTDWLSVAIIALITLRKGARQGIDILIPACLAYFAMMAFSLPVWVSLMNAGITFLPAFIGAIVLRATQSWSWVGVTYLLQAFIVAVLLHLFAPQFIFDQLHAMEQLLQQMQGDSFIMEMIKEKGLNRVELANYIIGFQLVGVIISALFALMLARSIQAQLFNPGGFQQEMQSFRGEKIGIVALIGVIIFAKQGNVLAINVLPALQSYYLLAGLSLGSHLLLNKKPLISMIMLFVPIVVIPFIMLPAYVIFGSLDSIFNLRNYLAVQSGKQV
jgi:hypothetical protein